MSVVVCVCVCVCVCVFLATICLWCCLSGEIMISICVLDFNTYHIITGYILLFFNNIDCEQ